MAEGSFHFYLRLATDRDFSAVMRLRIHAEQWLAAAGIEQWTDRVVGEQIIRRHLARGVTFVVESSDSEVIASFALDDGDPAFWTPEELGEPAAYLYKFMIDSRYRGTGLGDVLLDWACRRAAADGAAVLRLDCWKTNLGLQKYYLRHGFTYLGVRDVRGNPSGALFERPAERQRSAVTTIHLVDQTGRDSEIALAGTRPARSGID